MTTAPATHRVRVRTRLVPEYTGALVELLPTPSATLCWVNGGDGMVAWGELARFTAAGPRRFTRMDAWWRSFAARTQVSDQVRLPGTGAIAFASIAFADQPGDSVLVVPRVVAGRRDGVTWVTELTDDTEPRDTAGGPADGATGVPATDRLGITSLGRLRYRDGQLPIAEWRAAVAAAVDRLRAGELDKVVLAHDLLAVAERDVDQRYLLRGLTARYPNCWAFAVDGLVGATPELLVSRHGKQVEARVLAGTTWPHDELSRDQLASELMASSKNRSEHSYATRSMVEALRPFCSSLDAPDEPSVLNLRNVLHLATDVRGQLTGSHSVLRLAWLAHPTAAVGGTPAPDAQRLISELERMDRGRYAGPVGWLAANGDGELGIALRCAEVSGRTVRMFAGCGIMADSDPDSEVREAAEKLVPVRDALEGGR